MIDHTTLAPGMPVPPFSRQGTFQHWNRFAGVNDEFADHHMDDDVGRYEGFASAFGMAPLTFAYLHAMLRDWIGEEGRIVSLAIQLRSPFLRGRTLTASGTVREVQRDGDEITALLDIWADDNEGVRMVTGTAAVAVPA
jgi:hypothetical protein